MIKSMDYVRVISRKRVRGSGLDVGQLGLIIGMRDLPEKRSDPYLLRRYAMMVLVDEDGTHHMPNSAEGADDNGNRAYLVDPRGLEKVPEGESNGLMEKYKAA